MAVVELCHPICPNHADCRRDNLPRVLHFPRPPLQFWPYVQWLAAEEGFRLLFNCTPIVAFAIDFVECSASGVYLA